MLRLMDRSKPKGAPQTQATVLTFIASSVWHGTYPGYILTFIALSLLEIQGKHFNKLKIAGTVKKILNPLIITLGLWVWLFFNLAYWSMAFIFLEFSSFNKVYANLNYSLHFLMPLVTLMALYMPRDKFEKLKEK